jgi:hypothetical protein
MRGRGEGAGSIGRRLLIELYQSFEILEEIS